MYALRTINALDPDINAAGVEGSMLLAHDTLDRLSKEIFAREIALAKLCETRQPGFLKQCAWGRGLRGQWEAEERRLKTRRQTQHHRDATPRAQPAPSARRHPKTRPHRPEGQKKRYRVHRIMEIARGRRARTWWRQTRAGALAAAWRAHRRAIGIDCTVDIIDVTAKNKLVLRIDRYARTSGPWTDAPTP